MTVRSLLRKRFTFHVLKYGSASAAVAIAAALWLAQPAAAQRSYPVGNDYRAPDEPYVPSAPVAPQPEALRWPYGRPQYWDRIRQVWVRGYGLDERYSHYRILPDEIPARRPVTSVAIVGGKIDRVEPVAGGDRLTRLVFTNGASALVDLGPDADPQSLGIAPGREVIMSGNRVVIDGTPILDARQMTVDQGMMLSAARPTREQRTFEQQPLAYSSPDQSAQDAIANWPAASKKTAAELIRKYGEPEEQTQSMLIWQNNGPWVRTIVHREPVRHEIAGDTHDDIVEQTARIRVPADRASDVMNFGGHVMIDPVRGEVTSYCASEAANILTLNHLQEILRGDFADAAAARSRFEEEFRSLQAGGQPRDAQQLEDLRQ